MHANAVYRQPQRLLRKQYASSFILRLGCSTTSKRVGPRAFRCISCSNQSSSSSSSRPLLARPSYDIDSALSIQSNSQQSRPWYLHHQHRHSSTNATAAAASTLADIDYKVTELEQTAQSRPLTNTDVQHELWPLLANCASISTSTSSSQFKSSSKLSKEQSIFKAKLCNRILDLCLKGVEDRRVFLWDWLQTATTLSTTATATTNENDNPNNDNNFSPTKFWNEAPHPTKQMYNLVLTSWKSVITEFSTSSTIQEEHTSLQQMEQAATQSSTLLLQMEEEYASDVAFVQEYNSRVDRGRYTELLIGAAIPDVMNYSEVIGAWGQCIDGAGKRRKRKKKEKQRLDNDADDYHGRGDGGVLQKRLRLEVCAMKAMMELLESMEEDLYGTFDRSSSSSSTDDTNTTTNDDDVYLQQRKKPPPDRICYNIILTSMARQLNPSLYEMRLVLQRMMERVQFELENQDEEHGNEDDDDNYSFAMSFFPDIFSYNALIEARANRAAMFASKTSSTKSPQSNMLQQQKPQQRQQSQWREQLTSKIRKPMKSRFTSSEEEAILAEQMLEEINHISTVSVRPNIWSYNAVMKAWIKCGTERGLQRAVLLLRALAMNGTNSNHAGNVNDEGVDTGTSGTLFDRIARWGTSLLSNNGRSGQHTDRVAGSKSTDHNPQAVGVGIANRLNYLAQENPLKKKTPPNQISVGMHSRMLLMSSAFQSNDVQSSSSSLDIVTDEKEAVDPIGPLPFIESDITPDISSFRLLISALERRGSINSAKLAEDLLHLLEEYYCELAPTTSIYNSVLNAWAQAGKMGTDAKASFYAADRAASLLEEMLDEERQLSGLLPPPNESSFLMVINAMAHAANAALKAGNISDAKHAANIAEELLQKMEVQQLETRQIALSCRGSVVRIWASLSGLPGSRSSYAAQAHALLMKMTVEAGHLPIDVIYFNVVLDAWARDLSRKDKGQVISRLARPHELLMDLAGGKYNAMPDNSSFNHVIRACYSPWASRQHVGDDNERRKAWEMAFEIYSTMAERRHGACRPDAHTYTHLFKAISCLWPKATTNASKEKIALCRNIFHSCCQDGQLTKTSFWIFSTLLESSEFIDLLSHELRDSTVVIKNLHINPDSLYKQMPAEWSRKGRNVKSLNRMK